MLAEDLRLARLVDDLLLLAQFDERILVINAMPVDLDDLVMDEARRIRSTASLEVDTTSVSAGRVSATPAGWWRGGRQPGG